jgi:pyruvate/2-oxoglutarate dehydrogenase complex dihydrolipoamide acyltransferase (E2) component
MIAITMPQPSHYVTDGKVIHWYVKEGDRVQEGEPVLEIETMKATEDVLAPCAGTLVRIVVPAGETVVCETLLAEIEP